jgi:hypothetical protein
MNGNFKIRISRRNLGSLMVFNDIQHYSLPDLISKNALPLTSHYFLFDRTSFTFMNHVQRIIILQCHRKPQTP